MSKLPEIPKELLNQIAEEIKAKRDSIILELKLKINSLSKEVDALNEKKKLTQDTRERITIPRLISEKKNTICYYGNLILSWEKGFGPISFTDKRGLLHENIPSFKDVSTETILFDEDTILVEPTPPYIPCINEDEFSSKGYVFDAIRIGNDEYILAVNGYKEFSGIREDGPHPSDDQQGYVIVTLDQLVLISQYYTTKKIALNIKAAEEKNKRAEESYDRLSVEYRSKFLVYQNLPEKEKKKITKEEYNLLNIEEKEKIFKPFKRYRPERISSKLGSNQMWRSFHAMYERFINPEAMATNKDKVPIPIGKRSGYLKGIFGNDEVFTFWYYLVERIQWKLRDLKVQREILSDIRKAGIETSFGESNTSDVLKSKYGILVKRQNGTKIQPVEINQIEESWVVVNTYYGDISHIAEASNLKISHTGDKLVFASRFAGVYVPSMGTIAATNKFGPDFFTNVLGHEVSHFIDHKIGEKSGKRHVSDNYESEAGEIAIQFRKLMNKKSTSDYYNSTHECFARAMEQYLAVESGIFGIDYYSNDNYVSEENFNLYIKPIVVKFLEANKLFFKTNIITDEKSEETIQEEIGSEIEAIDTKAERGNEKRKILDAIESLELLGQKREANKLRLLLFVIDLFESGNKFMRSQVDEEAKKLGFHELGFVDHKLVKEIIELAIVIHARGKEFEDVIEIYNQQATLSVRTSESQALNQFSTSLPIAWILGKFCGIDKGGAYFEPSAGNGMLTVYGNPANFIVNDIDKDRLWSLRKQGFKTVLSQDATLPFDLPKFDAIITNPPFGGKVKGRIFNGVIQEKLDYLMSANALQNLKDSGKAAIITGGHISYKDNMVDGLQDWHFFVYLASNFNVVDVINIDSKKLYYKMGTSWPIKIVLINGVKQAPDKKEIEKVAYPIIRSWLSLSTQGQSEKFSIEPVSSFEVLNSRINGY